MSALLYVIFICFSLWDYYIPALGGRVFDYLGIGVALLYLATYLVGRRYDAFTFSVPSLLYIVAVFPAAIAGILHGQGLAVAALLSGLLLVYPMFGAAELDTGLLRRQLGWLIVVNLGFFFLQYAAYHFAGIVLDYHSRFGVVSPRVFNELSGYFRAAGLFQEPNSFSINLFMLVALRMFCGGIRADWIFWLSALALILSESLWGIGALVVLLLVRFNLVRLSVGPVVTFCGLAAITAWAVSVLSRSSELLELVFDPITVGRLFNLENDSSRQSRFEGEVPVEFDPWLVVGHGVDTEAFQGYMGANGVSFYVYAFGLLGMLLFLAWTYAESRDEFLPKAAIIVFAMTSYPLFTFAMWWAWLPLLFRVSRLRATAAAQAAVPLPHGAPA